jgi:hypothetical protein
MAWVALVVALVSAAVALVAARRVMALSRELSNGLDEQRRLLDELERHGVGHQTASPRLRVTRPTPYSSGDADWYEFEVLVSNTSTLALHGVAVTAFVGGRQAGETTEPMTIPPQRGVAFKPRVPRPEVLDGPLSIRAGNSETEAWWRSAN